MNGKNRVLYMPILSNELGRALFKIEPFFYLSPNLCVR